jgi:predicted ATPase/class 3 adenylate cyclase
MSGLPSGTVTFLFSDIEGSTRLLRRLGERYAEVLGRHDRLVRAACAGHGGREVSTQGDAFFVAFPRAGDAVAAAVQVQRALAAERWPEGAGVRVRIGLHTGEPVVGATDYIGLAVHRAARICAVGHGGQILVSSATRELLEDELAQGISFRDLGQRRLKDFDRPEHLFQVVVADLPADFPPPVLVAGSPRGAGGDGGLPAPPNRTLGREDDVRAIADRLRAFNVRLLTLTGPGGVGKTRLAVEAGRAVEGDFADGARFVSLAALRRPDDVPSAIVQALAIVPVPGETSEQAVTRFLSAKTLLLILDNVEHLLPAARFVADVLTASSALTILATSREPLTLHAEQRYPVAPLALPASGASSDPRALAGVAAVALFCDRARAHDPRFSLGPANAAAVAEICRHLDGLPLAIELAAARCGLLSPGEIAERLEDALGALGAGARDAPARQQTLRATIDWSHDLLNDAEKQCFARFAVFAGGATVQAAETITATGLDTLDGLVAKSLLVRRQHAHTGTRLGMLETIRAYASERFALTTDKDAVHERHYRHYLALTQRHGTERALWGADRNEHLARLDAEIDNFDEALRWAVTQPNSELALAMVRWLAEYWHLRNRFAHAVAWIDQALSIPAADAHPALRARALLAKVPCLWPLGRAPEQPAAIDEAAAIADEFGDPALISRVLYWRSRREANNGHLETGTALADEALRWATRAGDDWEIAMAYQAKTLAAPTLADLRELVDQAASRLSAVGNVVELGGLLMSAAYVALCEGSDRDAKALLDRAEPIARTLDDLAMLMLVRGNIGLAAVFTGDIGAARHAFREELQLCREMTFRPVAHEGLLGLAAVATVDGDLHRAALLVGAAAAHRCDRPGVDARLNAAFFQAARRRCGTAAWDTRLRDGATLDFEDAIAYALEEPRA